MLRYISLLLLLPGCGPVPLKSVAATGQIGAGLSTHVGAVRTANRHCQVLVANGDIKAETCQKLTAATPDAVRALTVLSGYGSALARIAKADDAEIFDNLSVVLGGGRDLGLIAVNDGQLGAIAGATQAIANLITHEYRRKTAANVVKEANPHIVAVADGLIGYLEGQEELLTNQIRGAVKLNLKSSIGRCDEKNLANAKMCLQDNMADRVVLHGFLADVDLAIAGVSGARRALRAFKAAHERLRKNANTLNDNDEAIYDEIVCRTSELYFGFGGVKPAGCK